MRVSEVSLPPLVDGPAVGTLQLSLGPLSWAAQAPGWLRQRRGALQARVSWWGDDSGGEAVTLPAPGGRGEASTSVSFPLHTGPKYLARYLRDMGCLTIAIEPAPSSGSGGSGGRSSSPTAGGGQPATAALAEVSVGLMGLDVQLPISGSFPIVLPEASGQAGAHGAAAAGSAEGPAIVGSLRVCLQLDYPSGMPGALVSSFELNEHLARADEQEGEGQAADGGGSGGGPAGNGGEPACIAAGALGAPETCTQLAAAVADSTLLEAALQQFAAAGGSEEAEGDALSPPTFSPAQLQQVAAALLPAAAPAAVEYAAAMLSPFSDDQDSSSGDGGSISPEQLAAAAGECAAVERRLQGQPACESARCLRQLAAALASRSLDLASAFAAAEGQRLQLAELGPLLRRLHPAATAEQARCLLALVAGRCPAATGSPSGIALPDLKAALAAVQEAQQFPTAEEQEQQAAAAAARRAKEAAAAAAAVLAASRAAAAQAALRPPSDAAQGSRRQAGVRRLKSSGLQFRRRSSSGSGGSQQAEAAISAAGTATAGVGAQPDVVIGIPVLPPPPPALLSGLAQPLPPATHGPALPAVPAAVPAAGAAADDTFAAQAGPLAAVAGAAVSAQPARAVPAQPAPQPAAPPDPVLQLIQQAEQLKAALEAANGSKSRLGSLLAAATSPAAQPRLPNPFLPAPSGSALAAAAAADGSLPAATAALVAAAKALREEGERLPVPAPAAGHGPLPVPAAAAAAPIVRPRAAAAAAVGTGDDGSDPESDAEDALLESLFFRHARQAQQAQQAAGQAAGQAGAPAASLPRGAASRADSQLEWEEEQRQPQAVLRVQLQGLKLSSSGSGTGGSSVRCVVKPLHRGGQPMQLTLPVGAASGACFLDIPLPPPAAQGSPGKQQRAQQSAPALPPYLFFELWQHSGSLLGVAKVPLLPPSCCSAPAGSGSVQRQGQQQQSAGGPLPAVVAEGRQPIVNILDLAGSQAGSVYVAAVLQERNAAPLAAAVRHSFCVRICSAHRLPGAAAYAAAGLRAPDGRMLCYSFPSEAEALQTGEVACCSNPGFDAAANHKMVLPAPQSILPLLQDGLLRFELFDCWADGQPRQQHAWAVLPLSELASLAAQTERGSNSSWASAGGLREASRALMLPLCTEYDMPAVVDPAGAAAQPGGSAAAGRAPCLKIELSYSAQLCTMDAAEAAAAGTQAEGSAFASPAKQQQQEQQEEGCGRSGSGSEDENSLQLANGTGSGGKPRRQPGQTPASPGRRALEPAAVAAAPAAPALASAPLPPPKPAEPSVPATLCVEVVRASGLAAAVREASVAASAGSGGAGVASSLTRAAAVGPHAFVRLALFAEEPALQAQAPPLQTAFVPQSFSPAWRAAHTYQLQLTGGMLAALATQSLRVEVWHRCSRATAASAGSSSSSGPREVLLGVGTAPLLDVLRRPQGLRCWVPLAPGDSSPASSGITTNVGAVQLAVHLSELGGPAASPSPSQEPLLLRCPQAAALVPPALRSRLLLPPREGFKGQPAVLAVHLDLLSFPGSSSSGSGSRPKADRFFCCYSPPGSGSGPDAAGSSASVTTAARVLTSVGTQLRRTSSSGAPAGASSRGGGRGTAVVAAAGAGQRWAAKLNHSGFFEVTAGPALVSALLEAPLQVLVYKQPSGASSSSTGSGSAAGGGASRSAVLVGTAELDLSSLLWGSAAGAKTGRPADGQQRSLFASFPLLEGAAASRGGASLEARVSLQLAPAAPAAEQAAAAAAAGVDAASAVWQAADSGPAAQLAGPVLASGQGDSTGGAGQSVPSQQAGQEEAAGQQWYPSPSSSDADSDEEELLQRCRRLVGGAGAEAGATASGQGAAAAALVSPGSTISNSTGSPAASGRGQPSPGQQQPQAGGPGSPQGKAAIEPASAEQQAAASQTQAGGLGAARPDLPGSAAGRQEEAAQPAVLPLSGQPGEPEAETGSLVILVETALHLPEGPPAELGLGSSSTSSYCAAVQAVWHQASARTAAVPVHPVEAADLGGTAVWQQELELGPASAAAWAAAAADSPGPGSVPGDGPSLLLNVWALLSGAESGQAGTAGSAAAAARCLVGCATVGLARLPLGEQRGWFQLTDSQQRQRGQLKVAVRPNAALLRQLTAQQAAAQAAQATSPVAAAAPALGMAAPASGAEGGGGEEDLQQQLAARLQELEVLSRRLAAAPPAMPAGASQPAALPSLPQQQQQQQQKPGAPAGQGPAVLGPVAGATFLRDLPGASEDENEEAAPFDARQTGFAWSGSDSDVDDLLVGLAVDGAVSPGFTDEEGQAEEEESRPREPRAPELLQSQDWMFAISRPTPEQERAEREQQAAAEAAAAAALGEDEPPAGDVQGQAAGQAAGQPAVQAAGQAGELPRRRTVFRHVLPSSFLGDGSLFDPWQGSGAASAAQQAAEAAAAQAVVLPAGAQSLAAGAPSEPAASQQQQQQQADRPPFFGPGWEFDIQRSPASAAPAAPPTRAAPTQPSAAAAATAAAWRAAGAAGGGQFAPMQPAPAATGPDLEEQRRQLAQQTERVRGAAGAAQGAATLDDVLESLLGRDRGRPGTGGPADSSGQ